MALSFSVNSDLQSPGSAPSLSSLAERGTEGSAYPEFSQFCLSELSVIASPDSEESFLTTLLASLTPDTPTDVIEENTPSFGILK